MSARLLAGKPVADAMLADVAQRAAVLAKRGARPGLATILVGQDAASAGYVRKKHEACALTGLYSRNVELRESTRQEELHETIHRLNEDREIHGVLVQHPLPAPLDLSTALLELSPDKDADGLHPANVGRLATGLSGPVPATPAGVRALLLHYQIPTAGRHVVVLGRGPTLGRPLSLLLSGKGPGGDAAVTLIHSRVAELSRHTLRADILVSGVGRPGIVQPDMVRPGAVVLSAGISWQGRRLLPDVDERVAEKASYITPRLGGVGVTTVAMLLNNTVGLAEARFQRQQHAPL